VIATELLGQLDLNRVHNHSQDEIDVLRERFVSMLDGMQSRDRARTLMLTEIAAARTLLVDVANAMSSALIVVTQDGTISFCNRAAMKATDNPTDMVVGKPLRAVFPYPKRMASSSSMRFAGAT